MKIDPAEKRALTASLNNSVELDKMTSRVKMCIYGDNGVGKTTAAVAMARKLIGPDKQIVFVDKSEGYESIRNFPVLMKNLRVIPFSSPEQLYVLAEMIYNKTAPYDNVGAVIFDDADYMAAQSLNELWQDRVENNPGSKLDKDMPERPEYLKLGFLYTDVLEFIYQKTPSIHVFLTAKAKEKKTQDGQTVLKVFPGFNPALAGEITGRLLVLGYMTAKVTKSGEMAVYERNIQVHPTFGTDAKSRIGCDKIKYEIMAFINHVVDWSAKGKPEENEVAAVIRDNKTSKVKTEDDVVLAATSVDEDEPIVLA